MNSLIKDDTALFKQFSDNESVRKWLLETVFALTYRPPGGMMGGAVAKLFSRAPVQQIQVELRRIKQTMEKPARCRRHAGGRKAQAMNDER